MEPIVIEEVIEQCDSKVHDGCYIFSDSEVYSFTYSLGAVNLIGEGINLDVAKVCSPNNNLMTSN